MPEKGGTGKNGGGPRRESLFPGRKLQDAENNFDKTAKIHIMNNIYSRMTEQKRPGETQQRPGTILKERT